MWKAEKLKIRLFGPFWPKSGLFRQKEDQFRSIFSKRSAIRPRSDKADLLGSTAKVCSLYDTAVKAKTPKLVTHLLYVRSIHEISPPLLR